MINKEKWVELMCDFFMEVDGEYWRDPPKSEVPRKTLLAFYQYIRSRNDLYTGPPN